VELKRYYYWGNRIFTNSW